MYLLEYYNCLALAILIYSHNIFNEELTIKETFSGYMVLCYNFEYGDIYVISGKIGQQIFVPLLKLVHFIATILCKIMLAIVLNGSVHLHWILHLIFEHEDRSTDHQSVHAKIFAADLRLFSASAKSRFAHDVAHFVAIYFSE